MSGRSPGIAAVATIAAAAVAWTALAGCAGTRGAPAAAPAWDDIANGSFGNVMELPVRLTDGRWEGEPYVPDGAARPSLTLAKPVLAQGDLQGNGSGESVVLLAESSGGSGTFQHVAVTAWRGARVVSLASAPLGDRVQVRSARIAGRRVVLDLVEAGPDDPASRPTRKVTRTWVFSPGELREEAAVDQGAISIRDLEGAVWVLDHLGWNERAPAEPVVTVEFGGETISGDGFCNRYFAGVAEPAPTELTIGEIAATRRACPPPRDALERDFLDALRHVRQYRFLAGRLALAWEKNGVFETMLFTPVPAAATPGGR